MFSSIFSGLKALGGTLLPFVKSFASPIIDVGKSILGDLL